MSLVDIKYIDSIKIDITPDGQSVLTREYIAENVEVSLTRSGKEWRTEDGRNHVNIDFQYLIFRISGELIDQITDLSTISPTEINQDLGDTAGYKVELYPDGNQAQKFEVILYNINRQEVLAAFTNLTRSETEEIICITRDPVSRANIEWFRRY